MNRIIDYRRGFKTVLAILMIVGLVFAYSPASVCAASISPPTKAKVSNYTLYTMTVSWQKASSVKGYKIYRSTTKTGTYKLIKTVTSSRTLKFKNTGLRSNTRYYYKVASYKIVDGKTVKSAYGNIATGRTSKPDGRKTVYISDRGTKYHLNRNCAGSSSDAETMTRAVQKGYEPCSRCADEATFSAWEILKDILDININITL